MDGGDAAAEQQRMLHFNLMEGAVTGSGAEHVDVGIRGVVTVDQLFESETDVNELPGVCN